MITPLDNTIKGVMELTWPMVIICVLIISSIRIVNLILNKNEFILYKEIINLFFIIYILCLFQIVTFQDDTILLNDTRFNLIPFKEILRYNLGSRLFFKNVIGNLVLFMPYGFFASYLTKNKKYIISFFLIIFASLSIEFTQLAIGRIFDIDDVILNVIGGSIGYLLYIFILKIRDLLPFIFNKTWVRNILTSLAVIGFIIYIWAVIL